MIFVGEDSEQQPGEPRVVNAQHDPPGHPHSSGRPRVAVVLIPVVHLVPQGEMPTT